MSTIEEILESARDIYGETEDGQKLLELLMTVYKLGKVEERAKIIFRGEELVGMYLDGPLRDSAYALFTELKTIE